MAKQKNPYEMLFDENNHDNLIFYDEKGNPMEFEQIALISIDETNYAILHPVHMGYQEDEVIVYSVIESSNEFELLEVEDKILLEEISFRYRKLFKSQASQ